MKKVAIVGGGVSGLAVAFALQELGVSASDMVVFEAKSRVGGNVCTDSCDGFSIEQGPNGFLDNSPATFELVEKLNIEDQLLKSNSSAAKRFIYRENKLREIQANPLKFLFSGVLPLSGTLRVCAEPFQKKPSAQSAQVNAEFVNAAFSDEESVFDFATRRIGTSAAELLVSAMVQGVFAGDAKKLELKSAFPKMYNMEQRYGSLFKAMISKAKAKKKSGGPAGPGGVLTSFVNGMETLPNALHNAIGDVVQTNSPIRELAQKEGFLLRLKDGTEVEAQTVVLANPSWSASEMVAQLNPDLAKELAQIYYPPVLVVATGFSVNDLEQEPNGFGFLVPRNQGVRSLGCLWSSSVWNHRAPDDHVLLRTMVGGAVDTDVVSMSDDEVTAMVLDELNTTMGIDADPKVLKVYRFDRAIAQYECGHAARMQRIEKQFLSHPGLFLSGSSYGGISVNHCVEEAPRVAKSVLSFLEK